VAPWILAISIACHARCGKKSVHRITFMMFSEGLTPRLTGAGARSAQGTNSGHENAEGMPVVCVRVEPTVRLGRVGREWQFNSGCVRFGCPQKSGKRLA